MYVLCLLQTDNSVENIGGVSRLFRVLLQVIGGLFSVAPFRLDDYVPQLRFHTQLRVNVRAIPQILSVVSALCEFRWVWWDGVHSAYMRSPSCAGGGYLLCAAANGIGGPFVIAENR